MKTRIKNSIKLYHAILGLCGIIDNIPKAVA